MREALLKIIIVVGLSMLTLIGYDNITERIDNVNVKVNSLQENQININNKINSINSDYLSLSDYIVYFEKILNEKFDDVHIELSQLDDLITNDDFLFNEIENIKQEYEGVNAGLGVLTGYHVMGEHMGEHMGEVMEEVVEEPVEIAVDIPEPIVYTCPKLDRSVDFTDYIENINFTRAVNIVVSYDIVDGVLTNVRTTEGKANSKLLRAITKYLSVSVPTTNNSVPMNIQDCSIPFKIEV
tara:strand:+ start:16 stop:735 length:720 start_codon:yes stop_codon:yes gene_type:complete